MERIKKESRKHARVAVYLKISDPPAPKLKEYTVCTHNLSLGGMMIVVTPPLKTLDELKVGENMEMSFVISIKAGVMNIPSRVAWTKEKVLTPDNEEASCAGVEFLSLSEQHKGLITEFLKEKIEKDAKARKKTCRECSMFKENPGSKYSFCEFHRITVLNSDENLTLSFNQIYLYPCKEFKPKG